MACLKLLLSFSVYLVLIFLKKTANHSNIRQFLLFNFRIPPFFYDNFQEVVSGASKKYRFLNDISYVITVTMSMGY